MMAGTARAVMWLTRCSLGESRRDWANAMEGEFEAALDDGRPLAFAAGCLIAAWREMPGQAEGRFVLASYAITLGMLIPMAVLQFACAVGLPFLLQGPEGLYGALAAQAAQTPYSGDASNSIAPAFLILWLLLCSSHLCIAWALLERDWPRIVRATALAIAAWATLASVSGVLAFHPLAVILQAGVLAIEIIAIATTARWHARLFPGAPSVELAS